MESKEKYFKLQTISLAKQAAMIEKTYDNFSCEITSNGELISIGNISPTPLSRIYTAKISYTIGHLPIIEIINPKLSDGQIKLPHVYKKANLCLFYPRNKEWTKYDYIADKIIPWISLWLCYYETWNITGEWKGGGIHPQPRESSKKRNSYIS